MLVPAKLVGGRYDGDSGTMSKPAVPESLYAYTCRSGTCHHGGIHWVTEKERADESTAELYIHTGFDGTHDEMPVAIYVAAPDGDPMPLDMLPEVAHA